MAGRGAALDEGVVVRDVGGRGVALGGGEEQQPELVARGQAGGLEAPVRGDLGGGGGSNGRRLRAGQRLGVAGVVGEAHLHFDRRAQVGIHQRVGARRRRGDVRLSVVGGHPDPLEAGIAVRKKGVRQPVHIRDGAHRRGQCLAHLRRAGDRRRAGGGGVGRHGHLEDRREPVHGEGGRGWLELVAAEGTVGGRGGLGPADAHNPKGRAERARKQHTDRLGAVVLAAGPGGVDALGGIEPGGAGLVLAVDHIVPGPVVEIFVLVGGLGAGEPVDGDALVGAGVRGGGVVAGVDGGSAADRPEARAVGLDGDVAGRGAGLDEGVVVRDVGGRGVALGGGQEQQPELVADGQAGGREGPVRGDLGDDLGVVDDDGDAAKAGGEVGGIVADGVLDGLGVVGGRGVGEGDHDDLVQGDLRPNRDLEHMRYLPLSDGGNRNGGAVGSDSEGGGGGQVGRLQVL